MGKYLTKEEFVEKAKRIHDNKYDYEAVEYIDNKTEVLIYCKTCQEYFKRIDHLLEGSGCPMCLKEKITKTSEEFIKQANSIHNNKYDYSQIKYINNRKKIKIFCKEHNEYFWQLPSNHLKGKVGCKYCIPKSKGENAIKNWLIMKDIKFEFQKGLKIVKISSRYLLISIYQNTIFVLNFKGVNILIQLCKLHELNQKKKVLRGLNYSNIMIK